ncbi:Aspartyl/glutamyl-tRNA(Asn/Gln) amidotransferase, B subunit,Aspartyl/Glutamyl-tRNA(Gln) [Cinara cedri]|uniref:Glutamyl-tRNA(Gln) amidotransferase subunit B, mitochondrial n=1 Tax=Cinara cedri TaxID=506608 RepID=A0A5E4MZ46_9HEMI|nr:Aspartyl/glutamyl-tRNA(Asn/Gln) amidotransferase, B subunit,Aspartyl/Glutamyl-tRNA(Gln) [Cinara cedri]
MFARKKKIIHTFKKILNLAKLSRNKSTKIIDSKWKSVVGLEIHAQIFSESKLFSAAGTKFEAAVNSQVSLFDAAIPGTLPSLNEKCVEAVVLTALVLKCNLNTISLFDRKHYFYADMPAGYQITQQFKPLAVNGQLTFHVIDQDINKVPYSKTSLIKQVQIEQDSGRTIHDDSSQTSLIDLNRAGTGLMELVFEPDLCNGLEASSLVKELLLIFERIKTCSGRMEEGALRVDANVSITNSDHLGTRTEIKNLGSIRAVQLAVDYEIHRQLNILKAGKEVVNETRGWDSLNNKTISMRDKEVLQDYRFMPEPNLLPINLNLFDINKLQSSIPELPDATRINLMSQYKLDIRKTSILMNEPVLLSMFYEIMNSNTLRNPARVWNILTNELMTELNIRFIKPSQCKIPSYFIGEVVDLLDNNTLNISYAKKVIAKLFDESDKSPSQIIEENNWEQICDVEEINKICEAVLVENPKAVKDYRRGKVQALKFLTGQIAKKTDHRINFNVALKKLEELLNN